MEWTNEMIIRSIRTQAWERAKGELRAVLSTYYERDEGNFEAMDKAVSTFIKHVEDNGLQE